MSRQERLKLFSVIKENRIKMKDVAEGTGLSAPLLSRFFNNQVNMSVENVQLVKDYIMNYEKGS